MADDSTMGSRGVTGTGESHDGMGDQWVPAASICHVVHEEQVGELDLSRDNLKRLLASGSFFWIDLARPKDEDFAVLRDVFRFHRLPPEGSEGLCPRGELDDLHALVFPV